MKKEEIINNLGLKEESIKKAKEVLSELTEEEQEKFYTILSRYPHIASDIVKTIIVKKRAVDEENPSFLKAVEKRQEQILASADLSKIK